MGNATFFQLSSSCTRNNEDGNNNNNNDYDVDDEDNNMCSLSSKLIQFSFLKINSISNIITIIIIKWCVVWKLHNIWAKCERCRNDIRSGLITTTKMVRHYSRFTYMWMRQCAFEFVLCYKRMNECLKRKDMTLYGNRIYICKCKSVIVQNKMIIVNIYLTHSYIYLA